MLDGGKWLDVLSFFEEHGLEILLLAEAGVSASTHVSALQGLTFDLACAPHSLPGYGVGAIFCRKLANKWFRADELVDCHNFRAWAVSWHASLFLLGAAYSPHVGYAADFRESYFRKIGSERMRLRRKFPNALCLLMGDMNLPSMVPAGSSACFEAGARAPLNDFFRNQVMSNLVVANCLFGPASPTHVKGNVLDLALISEVSSVLSFEVKRLRLAGSDHFPIILHLGWVGQDSPLRWVNFRDIDVQSLVCQLEVGMLRLHPWLEQSIPCSNCTVSCLRDILLQASCAFGIIVLGTLFQVNSPFGRFCSLQASRRRSRFPAHIREAVRRMRDNRGTCEYRACRRVVHKQLLKQCRKEVLSSVTRWGANLDRKPTIGNRMFRQVQKEIFPLSGTSQIVCVEGEVLDQMTAALVWTAFLESQTSWSGQVEPSEWLRMLDGREQFHEPVSDQGIDSEWGEAKRWLCAAHNACMPCVSNQFSRSEFCDACHALNPNAAPLLSLSLSSF